MAVIIPYFRTAIRHAANRNSIGRHLGDYHTNWDRRHLGGGKARAPRASPGGASRLGEPCAPYGTTTTTLKNRIAAFSATVAPSTAFHSPSNVATPFSTTSNSTPAYPTRAQFARYLAESRTGRTD